MATQRKNAHHTPCRNQGDVIIGTNARAFTIEIGFNPVFLGRLDEKPRRFFGGIFPHPIQDLLGQ
jgi:hypothetical protein